ncbi:hypothetical protein GGI21_000510 [Coemansia aciculifera]|nr:hypothetical protein GGI21_000510 [Coemansia aciculifera]
MYPPTQEDGDADPTTFTERAAVGGDGHARYAQPPRGRHELASLSISEGDDQELDDDDSNDDEDIDVDDDNDNDNGGSQYNSKRKGQWPGGPQPMDATNPDDLFDHASYYADGDSFRARMAAATDMAGPGGGGGNSTTTRAQSPRSARRLRNRLAAARMRTRQKQQLVQLEKRKSDLERRATELESELRSIQQKNNPLNSSIDRLAEMIDELTKVEFTMLTGIDECKGLLQNLEKLYETKQQQQQQQI